MGKTRGNFIRGEKSSKIHFSLFRQPCSHRCFTHKTEFGFCQELFRFSPLCSSRKDTSQGGVQCTPRIAKEIPTPRRHRRAFTGKYVVEGEK